MVPPASHRVTRVRWYSGYCRLDFNFAYGIFTLYDMTSQSFRLSKSIPYAVRNPICITTYGLASFHFARRYFENRCFFLFLRLLRCFSSAGLPPYSYLFTARWLGIAQPGCPIRKSAGQRIFAPLRSLSQLVTSFVGSWCQGILPVLFIAWSLHYVSLVIEIVLPFFGKTYFLNQLIYFLV